MKTILAALPGSRNLSTELLISLYDAFGDYEGEEIRVWIKAHPTIPLKRLRAYLPKWPNHFEEIGKPIPEILDEIDLLIFTSSTVGLEALLKNVRVVNYFSETIICVNPLDALNTDLAKHCSYRNLRQVVLSVLNEKTNTSNQQVIINNILNEFLSPVDEEIWLRIAKS